MRTTWKKVIRRGVAGALSTVGVPAARRRQPVRALTVLRYHRVLPAGLRAEYPFVDLAVTPEALGEHVAYCRTRYTCLTLREAAQRLADGDFTDKPLLVLTFDDGYWDNAHHARPVLEAQGVRGTFFVVTDLVGSPQATWYDRLARAVMSLRSAGFRAQEEDEPGAWLDAQLHAGRSAVEIVRAAKALPPDQRLAVVDCAKALARRAGYVPSDADRLMTLDELRAMAAAGHEVASHTCSHPILTLLSAEECAREVGESRRRLSELLGEDVISLAYPNGDCNETVVAVTRAAGYRWAVTCENGGNGRDFDPLRIRRYAVVQEQLAGRDGRFCPDLFDLEMTGLADTIFCRKGRGV